MKKILILLLTLLMSSCTYTIDFDDCYVITSKELGLSSGEFIYTVRRRNRQGYFASPSIIFHNSKNTYNVGDTVVFCKK